MSLESLLGEGAADLGIQLEDVQIQKLITYLKLLKKWNRRINLTSVTDGKDIVIKHFLDSLSISELLSMNARILDIGSGAGFPGLPLSIVNPGLSVTLLDTVGKKVVFMREVIRKLKLNNAVAITGKAEDVNSKLAISSFDFVLTRAVGSIKEVLNVSLPYVKNDGKVLLMRGKDGEREWSSFINGLDSNKRNCLKAKKLKFRLPFSDYKRVVLIVG